MKAACYSAAVVGEISLKTSNFEVRKFPFYFENSEQSWPIWVENLVCLKLESVVGSINS